MKTLITSVLTLALALPMSPISLIAARRASQTGEVSGAATVDGKPLGNVTVRLRNVDSGELVGDMQSNAQGQFSFTGLPPGNYVVETVSVNGTLLGFSTKIVLAAGTMTAAGVTVSTTGTALSAAGGAGAAAAGGAATGGAAAGGAAAGGAAAGGAAAGGAAAAGAGGLGGLIASSAGLVSLAATGLTTLAVTTLLNASGSQ